MPKVSIIVPVYKVEKYIGQCVDSILNQTFTDWECILVNDGSPDESGVVCDKYAHKDTRIKVIHKPNGGVSSARNAGLSTAQGEYVYFIDSDDYVEREALELSVSKAKQLEADIIVHGLVNDYIYNRSSTAVKYISLPEKNYSTILEMADRWGLLKGPVNKLFKKSIIQINALRFDESISYGEDTKFTFEYLAHCHSIAFVPMHLYHYCFRNKESLTSKDYPFDFWIKTAEMLRDIRLPIMRSFNMPLSYRDFVYSVFASHVSKAIKSLYVYQLPLSKRLRSIRECGQFIELKHFRKEFRYLNRMVFLLKSPLMLDISFSIAQKINKELF